MLNNCLLNLIKLKAKIESIKMAYLMLEVNSIIDECNIPLLYVSKHWRVKVRVAFGLVFSFSAFLVYFPRELRVMSPCLCLMCILHVLLSPQKENMKSIWGCCLDMTCAWALPRGVTTTLWCPGRPLSLYINTRERRQAVSPIVRAHGS